MCSGLDQPPSQLRLFLFDPGLSVRVTASHLQLGAPLSSSFDLPGLRFPAGLQQSAPQYLAAEGLAVLVRLRGVAQCSEGQDEAKNAGITRPWPRARARSGNRKGERGAFSRQRSYARSWPMPPPPQRPFEYYLPKNKNVGAASTLVRGSRQ